MKNDALYVRSIALRGLPEFIQELGGSPKHFFAKAKLNIAHINENNFYDWSNTCQLLELAASELEEPSFGIKWAHRLPMDFLNSGPMLFLGILSPTIRNFFNTAIEYQKLHTNGVEYNYCLNTTKHELECHVQIHPLSPSCRQYSEHIMATAFLLERNHLNKANFKRVTFQHKAPDDLTWHEKTFKCPVLFDNEKTAAFTRPEYLDVKLGGQLRVLNPVMRHILKKRINRNPRYETSISATVTQILPTLFGMRKSKITEVAEVLELNPKKLQRLLKDEGNTYSDILESVRKKMTERLLIDSNISITHLAKFLDYASNEAYNSACKRWFGHSPRKYRQQLRGNLDGTDF